jgi:hypothetical protein
MADKVSYNGTNGSSVCDAYDRTYIQADGNSNWCPFSLPDWVAITASYSLSN